MLHAASHAMGRLLAAGPLLCSQIPASHVRLPSARSPSLAGQHLSSLLLSVKARSCFWLCCGTPLGGLPPVRGGCPVAPLGCPPHSAKLGLSCSLTAGQELQGFGKAPVEQFWGRGASVPGGVHTLCQCGTCCGIHFCSALAGWGWGFAWLGGLEGSEVASHSLWGGTAPAGSWEVTP